MNDIITKNNIDALEVGMLQLPQAECNLTHKFENGYYIRQVEMPAGIIAIGHYQNFEHLNVFVKGSVLMLNPDGSTSVLTAPMTFVGKPGRKVGYILEDVVWQNVYGVGDNPEKVEVMEAMYLTKSQSYIEDAAHRFAMQAVLATPDREDYHAAVAELGYTESEVQLIVHNNADQVAMPEGDYKFVIDLSPIDGYGVFASKTIDAGEVIGPSRCGIYRTPLGRMTNHAKFPNAEMVFNGNGYDLVAVKQIAGAMGGQQGQEITVDYRAVRKLVENE